MSHQIQTDKKFHKKAPCLIRGKVLSHYSSSNPNRTPVSFLKEFAGFNMPPARPLPLHGYQTWASANLLF